MNDILRMLEGFTKAVYWTLIGKPVRERGFVWTFLAWGFLLASVGLAFELARLGLILTFAWWFVSALLFMKAHTKQKRRARPLPNRRRR